MTAIDPHRIVVTQRPDWVLESLTFDTIPKLFWQRVAELGDAVMMRQKDLGIWRSYSWKDVGAIVTEVAAGLSTLGFGSGQVASVLANTCREWVWVDLAVQSLGGVANGIYPTDAAAQCEYLCTDSASVILLVEDDEQLDKVLEVRERLPLLRKIIVFDMEGLTKLDDPQVMSLDALRELGRAELARQPELVQQRVTAGSSSDLAVLVYTSGTTGRPKGAMLRQSNLCAVLAGINSGLAAGLPDGGERIAFLPLCHIAERMVGEYVSLFKRSVLNFVENPETVFDNLREVQPTIFFAVPRVWEKIYSSVAISIKEAGKLQQLSYAWALSEGVAMARHAEARTTPGPLRRLRYAAAKVLVLNNVRRMVGLNRVEVALTGAAPISPELIRWYMALGITLREAWGMTETAGGGTVTPRGESRPGSIGIPGPGLEMRISEQGEILARGANIFSGYLNLPDKTAEAIDAEGWLHTGDVGRVDEQGWFYITDRMKDIIITAGGKNVTPSEWENQLKFSPYVTDAVVIGDKRAYLSCLVMIDQDNVEQWAQERDIPFSDYRSLCRAPEVLGLIAAEVEKVNKAFARVEQIKQFRLLEQQLTAEDEELTPTMKLKRSLVSRKYAELIEGMYGGKDSARAA